jgi:uncharacterized membrane protein
VERGKDWTDKITIIRDEDSKRPKVEVEGLWSGKDRRTIYRMLLKEMRRQANKIMQMHRQADLKVKSEEQSKIDIKQKRLDALEKARAAKKLKKLKEEEKKDVRGQSK